MAQRILIVEAEEAVREIFSAVLTNSGYECSQAESGPQALAMLSSGARFDLMLTELIMAGMDGLTLMYRVRAEYPDMAMAVVCPVNGPLVALTAFRIGACDYLLMPFEREQLLDTVEQAFIIDRRARESGSPSRLSLLLDVQLERLREALSKRGDAGEDDLSFLIKAEYLPKQLWAYVIAVAGALGLSREQIKPITRGAALHEIGQLLVLRDVLSEPEKLQDDDLATLRQNCHDIYQLLKPIPFLAEASETIYAYREHFDGKGEPRGLKGLDIPLGARIFSVAREINAAGYNAKSFAGDLDAALEKLQHGAGHRFDPEIVKTVMAMPKNIWGDLSAEVYRK